MTDINSIATKDEQWMDRALLLCASAVWRARILIQSSAQFSLRTANFGQGFHDYDLRDHAEIVALKKAGKASSRPTLYVTLEPCCTTGRTGPCTDADHCGRNKKSRSRDPRSQSSCFRQRARAIAPRRNHRDRSVFWKNEAQQWNADFACWIQTKSPARHPEIRADARRPDRAKTRTSHSITSEHSRYAVQRLRHEADAILTGIGTVLADDPRLTDRTGEPRRRPLLRAIVDSRLRTPLRSKLVRSAQHDVVIFTTQSPDSPKARALVARWSRNRPRPLTPRPCRSPRCDPASSVIRKC